MTEIINVGDRVRSYDVENSRSYYIEGEVLEIVEWPDGTQRYRILASKDVWNGVWMAASKRVGQEFFPPVNGTQMLFGGVTEFVERIS